MSQEKSFADQDGLCGSGRLNEFVNSLSGRANTRAKTDRFTP